MTIGIAAWGPRAGLAVLQALRAVEAVGQGAVGGFVAAVALPAAGGIVRIETQRQGTRGLGFDDAGGNVEAAFLGAGCAALMSSGPDRPAPLAQFTPAAPGIGIVTGHRLPNVPGRSGEPLNVAVLARMQEGAAPWQAVADVAAADPAADAGLLAITVDGRLGLADTARVRRRNDRGRAVLGSRSQGAIVGVLHNAIVPVRALALLAADIGLEAMLAADRAPDFLVTLEAGTALELDPAGAALDVDAAGTVRRMTTSDVSALRGTRGIGLGDTVQVRRDGILVGLLLYEPYMVVVDGRLVSADGYGRLELPVRRSGLTPRSPSSSLACPD